MKKFWKFVLTVKAVIFEIVMFLAALVVMIDWVTKNL